MRLQPTNLRALNKSAWLATIRSERFKSNFFDVFHF